MSLRFWNPASLRPMRLLRIPKPFDHSDWIFEPKMDGFRALAHVAGYRCTLLSRNGIPSGAGPQLHEEIAHSIRAYDAILDGEIAGLEPDGRSNFRSLLFRRQWPFFLAFDLLMLEGQDLRRLPLIERKRRPRRIMPGVESRLRFLDHIEARGVDLFSVACDRDVEGIVGKWRSGRYASDSRSTSWVKLKNPTYSQMEGRHELFKKGRHGRRHTPFPPALAMR